MTGAPALETEHAAMADGALATPARLAFVDLAALLAPIQDGAPAGMALRYDPVFDRIREARREDDASLPQGIWARDLKRADWAEVDRVGSAAMVMRGKDLQVGGWLLEAWIRLHGFAGARQGFELLFGLADRYWAALHPLPDGTDFGARIATIEWVNEKLVATVASIPVTAPTDDAIRAWTWAERDDVLRHENDQRRLVLAKGAKPPASTDPKGAQFTSDAFGVSAEMTPRPFYTEAVEDLGAAISAARALVMIVDEWCGTEAPSLSQVIDTMTAIRDWMKPMAVSPHAGAAVGQQPVDEVPAAEPEPAGGPTNGERMDATEDAGPASPTDHARARVEAYRKLAEAAQTLMRIEPHSPTPYLVRRAIAWGGMSLAELMRHFIDSGYDLKSLYSMLGMDEGEER
jgi:type VI secretion system ImpA family protein